MSRGKKHASDNWREHFDFSSFVGSKCSFESNEGPVKGTVSSYDSRSGCLTLTLVTIDGNLQSYGRFFPHEILSPLVRDVPKSDAECLQNPVVKKPIAPISIKNEMKAGGTKRLIYTNSDGEEEYEDFGGEEPDPIEEDIPIWNPFRGHQATFHDLKSVDQPDSTAIIEKLYSLHVLGCDLFGSDISRLEKPYAISFSGDDDYSNSHIFFIRLEDESIIPFIQNLFESDILFIFHDVRRASDALYKWMHVKLVANQIMDSMLTDHFIRSQSLSGSSQKTILTRTLDQCIESYLDPDVPIQPKFFKKEELQLMELKKPELTVASKNLLKKRVMLLPLLDEALHDALIQPLKRAQAAWVEQFRDCNDYERKNLSYKNIVKVDTIGVYRYKADEENEASDIERIRSMARRRERFTMNRFQESNGAPKGSSKGSVNRNGMRIISSGSSDSSKLSSLSDEQNGSSEPLSPDAQIQPERSCGPIRWPASERRAPVILVPAGHEGVWRQSLSPQMLEKPATGIKAGNNERVVTMVKREYNRRCLLKRLQQMNLNAKSENSGDEKVGIEQPAPVKPVRTFTNGTNVNIDLEGNDHSEGESNPGSKDLLKARKKSGMAVNFGAPQV